MADLDFGKIKLFVGNYDFWKESSELALKLQGDANRKSEEKSKNCKTLSRVSLPMRLNLSKRHLVKNVG